MSSQDDKAGEPKAPQSPSEEPKVTVSFKDANGNPINVELSLDNAEALGLQLLAQAASRRPEDKKPLHEQQPFMVVNHPPTQLFLNTRPDGTAAVGLFAKPNHFRPVQLWYEPAAAKEIAYTLLNLAGGSTDGPKN